MAKLFLGRQENENPTFTPARANLLQKNSKTSKHSKSDDIILNAPKPCVPNNVVPCSKRIGWCRSVSSSWSSSISSTSDCSSSPKKGTILHQKYLKDDQAGHFQCEEKANRKLSENEESETHVVSEMVSASASVTEKMEIPKSAMGDENTPNNSLQNANFLEGYDQLEIQELSKNGTEKREDRMTLQTTEPMTQIEKELPTPTALREVAVHPIIATSDANKIYDQDKLDCGIQLQHGERSNPCPSSNKIRSRRVQWQETTISSPKEDNSHEVIKEDDTFANNSNYNPCINQDECVGSERTVSIEHGQQYDTKEGLSKPISIQPLNKCIRGGPLHVLESLAELDLCKPNWPQESIESSQQSVHSEDSFQPYKISKTSNDLSSSHKMMLESFEPQSSGEKSNDEEFLANKDTSTSIKHGQCILMRANMAYEPVVKGGVPPLATNKVMTLRKKIKLKAPVPKQCSKNPHIKMLQSLESGKRASEQSPETDIHDQNKVEMQTNRNSPCSQAVVPVKKNTETVSERKDAHKEVQSNQNKILVCNNELGPSVVTHNEHGIYMQELQDPPSRRRWPKVSSSSTFAAGRNVKTSSTSSTSNEVQDGRTSNATWSGGRCEILPIQADDIIEKGANTKQNINFQTRGNDLANIEEIMHRSISESNETSNHQVVDVKYGMIGSDSNSTEVVHKTGLEVSVLSPSVRDASLRSRSMNDALIISNSHSSHEIYMDSNKMKNSNHNELSCKSIFDMECLSTKARISNEPHDLDEVQQTVPDCSLKTYTSNFVAEEKSDSMQMEPSQTISSPEKHNLSKETFDSTTFLATRIPSSSLIYTPNCVFSANNQHEISKEAGKYNRISPSNTKLGKSTVITAAYHENPYPERASLSSEKLCNILSYLGQVEESNLQDNYAALQKPLPKCYSANGARSPKCVLDHDDSISVADSTFTTSLTNMSNRSVVDSNSYFDDGDGNLKAPISLFEGVRKKIKYFKDKISAHELKNADLSKELGRVKAEMELLLSQEREKFGKEREALAAEYTRAIEHHLFLNEKMRKDKDTLSEKCCNLTMLLSSAESKFEEKLKNAQEQAAQDLKKQKEIWISGEKPRREAWKEMKLKEIKEITIKGLEPHIEEIVEKHKQEIQRLETRHANDIQKQLELQNIQQRQEISELRNRLLKERDDLLEQERMAALQRMNEVAQKYEQQSMQLRMRVSGDMTTELERLEESRRKDKHDAQELLSKFHKEASEREDALRKGLERTMQDAILVREDEIKKLRAELLAKQNEWETIVNAKVHEEMVIREKHLQDRFAKERDEQIEMIIERMMLEKDEAADKNQQDLLTKVEKLMEDKLDFMKRMKDVESKCATLCQLSLEAKQRAEKEVETKDAQLTSLERELLCQVNLVDQLKSQISQDKLTFKQQEEIYEAKIKKEQEMLQFALLDVEKYNAEVQQIRVRKAEELAEVETHVRHAIDNKDLLIAGLKEQLLSAREQIRHTELLLSG